MITAYREVAERLQTVERAAENISQTIVAQEPVSERIKHSSTYSLIHIRLPTQTTTL